MKHKYVKVLSDITNKLYPNSKLKAMRKALILDCKLIKQSSVQRSTEFFLKKEASRSDLINSGWCGEWAYNVHKETGLNLACYTFTFGNGTNSHHWFVYDVTDDGLLAYDASNFYGTSNLMDLKAIRYVFTNIAKSLGGIVKHEAVRPANIQELFDNGQFSGGKFSNCGL